MRVAATASLVMCVVVVVIVFMPMLGLGVGVSAVVGRHLGANRPEAAERSRGARRACSPAGTRRDGGGFEEGVEIGAGQSQRAKGRAAHTRSI